VIDFIDMGPHRNQREVENRLRDAVRRDRARIQIGKISRFGLLEMSRQRLRPSLEESTQLVCPRCGGNGVVRGVESLALAVLRLVGEEARKDRTAKVIAVVPIEVGNYILNEKRDWVQSIQQSNSVSVVIVSDPELETPNYSIRRVRDDETDAAENSRVSYGMVQTREDPGAKYEQMKPPPKPELPAVAELLPETPAPEVPEERKRPAKARPSLWQRILAVFQGDAADEETRTDSRRRQQPSNARRPQKPARRSEQNERKSQSPSRKSRSRSDGNRGQRNASASGGSSEGSGSRGRRSRGRRGRGSGGQSQRGPSGNNDKTPQGGQQGSEGGAEKSGRPNGGGQNQEPEKRNPDHPQQQQQAPQQPREGNPQPPVEQQRAEQQRPEAPPAADTQRPPSTQGDTNSPS